MASVVLPLKPNSQLAVCRGLVIDRMQRIKTNKNILVGRVCPASYGVLCDLPYERNNTQHVGQETFKNPINGLLYVKNQVDWMIKKVHRAENST
jgi:hypothetical protein